MTAASKSMSNIKRYMERQAAKEALSAPCQAKNRTNNNGNGNGSSNNTGNSNRRSRGRNRGCGNNRNSNNSGGCGGNRNTNQGCGGNQTRTQASDACPLAGHAGHTWGNCKMNVYNLNRRQAPARDAHNVERRAANPQAASQQPRAAPGSNLSPHLSVRPTRGTTFQPPVDTNYESYFHECHPIYIDKPDSFFSGQEFKPETYNPVVEKIQLLTVLQYATFQEEKEGLNHEDSVTGLACLSRLFKHVSTLT
jgi:hypothetical protein